MNAGEILTEVKDRFGISLSEVNTGGGCMALHARLETGHWIVATDVNLSGFADRVDSESYSDSYNSHYSDDYRAMGWSVGIYPDMGGDEQWFGADSIVDVVNLDLYAEDLPAILAEALDQLMKGM